MNDQFRSREELIRITRAFRRKLNMLASGPNREEISRVLQGFEEMSRVAEHGVEPFSEVDLYIGKNYEARFSAEDSKNRQSLEKFTTVTRNLNTSIAGDTSQYRVDLGLEEGFSREEVEQWSQEAFERQLAEAVPARVFTKLKEVEFVPFYLLDKMLRSPELMRQLNPHEFERFIATLIDKLGFEDIVITPRSNDQGRDILAVKRVHRIPVLFAFECKRYRPDKPIGVEVLRALLGTISHGPTKANKGILVTTSRFTSGARRFIISEPSLDGQDFNGILEWLKEYAGQIRSGIT